MKAIQRVKVRECILAGLKLRDQVNVFFARITIPPFLMALCANEGQSLATIWASSLSLFFE
ncbi:hypothetical protein AUG19_00980 [archaeon 13_1_20CM_2_54_9]|nr:MAG: hypothetical protein AUJ07_04860 [Crenarchaeota archaeon 13_1_40CM_3_53_5]OLE77312.1 MAG: hypothetical protein AUG19_00980 [archaeon 13_1_20CM_2_54_9]